jgi:hypothetical protein
MASLGWKTHTEININPDRVLITNLLERCFLGNIARVLANS